LAFEVAQSLEKYIAIHDFIFKESATFMSLLKTMFGRSVPVEDLLLMVQPLENDWETISRKVHAFGPADCSSLSGDEAIYINLLQKYVHAVQRAVRLLIDRQKLVLEIKRNGKNGPSFSDLQQMEAVYKKAAKEYVREGIELNRNAHLVGPWPRS
jgi:hypothetical protein